VPYSFIFCYFLSVYSLLNNFLKFVKIIVTVWQRSVCSAKQFKYASYNLDIFTTFSCGLALFVKKCSAFLVLFILLRPVLRTELQIV